MEFDIETEEHKDTLLQLLPLNYKGRVIKTENLPNNGFSTVIRISLTSKEAALQWLSDLKKKSKITYRVLKTREENTQKILFKKEYKCMHNSQPKRTAKPHPKHLNCNAKLTSTIKKSGMKRSKDAYLKSYPCEILLRHNHNHPFYNSTVLKYRPPSIELGNEFKALFEKGHSPSTALSVFKDMLYEEHSETYNEVVADGQKCPTRKWLYDLYCNIFKKEYGEPTGSEMIYSAKKYIDEYNKKCGEICAAMNTKDNLGIAVCSPIMKRVHQYIKASGEIMLVGASGNMDRHNTKVFLFLCPSVAGALPLGVLMVYSESEDAITSGINLLKTIMPKNAFYGKNCPDIIVTDDCPAECNSLHTCFENSTLLLCKFHVLQAVMRFLWDKTNGVGKDERVQVYTSFKKALNCVRKYRKFANLDEKAETMIAAKDPQEFIPSGRQQLLRHPGLSELYNAHEGDTALSSEFLANRFEKVSIAECKQTEWWIVRKSPNFLHKKEQADLEVRGIYNKSCLGTDVNRSHQTDISDSSWTWKNVDPPHSFQKINKRLSDIQAPKKRYSSDNDLFNDSNKLGPSNKTSLKSGQLKCKNVGIMEEELYVKDNVVIWTKGLTSSGNITRFDSSRITLCSYTSHYPVKHAQWCTFYCERPTFDHVNIENLIKPEEPLGTPLPSICIVDNQNLQVFTVENEDFVTTLPFQVGGLWTTKFGILLEKEKKHLKNRKTDDEELSYTIFSMAHPLDEVCPVAIRQGSVRLMDDISLNIIFTSENPSICMLYDIHTGQHSVYFIRKVRNDEWLEISEKLRCTMLSAHNLSNRLKNRLSVWDVNIAPRHSPSPSSRPTSVLSTHSYSQQQSRSQSPMAAISRCQSPTVSPLVGGNPWLRTSRMQSSVRNISANNSTTTNNTQFETELHNHVNPTLCFEHVWTDTSTSQQEGISNGPASKVFLSDDLVGRWYLCYLIPSRSQLSIVHVEFFSTNLPCFGIFTSISAKDAVSIPHLHMIAILEHNGSVVLYSGLTVVGKLHVGGVLAQHAPSPCIMRSLPQFNSPFPRRSTLLPHYGTPKAEPIFDEHLLSPVLPLISPGRNFNTNIPLKLDPYKLTVNDPERIQLNGLKDAIEDRLTLQYSDNTYYRITLPALASSTLVENCLVALRQTLQRDFAITLLTRWYAARNAPGPDDLSVDQEWNMFTSLICELLGYDSDQSSDMPLETPVTPSSAAKKQRPSSLGADSDWNLLLDTEYHKRSSSLLSEILHLRTKPKKIASASKHSEMQVNVNSVLFPCIRIIHYTLHLLYEELKLNTARTEELLYLAQFLSKLSQDLMLKDYIMHYWKDFPNQCALNFSNTTTISLVDIKNIVQWSIMNEQPESIMDHIYCLLRGIDVPPFPYICDVNVRSKAVVQLCGVFIKGTKNCNIEICPDNFIKPVIPPSSKIDSFSTPKSKVIDPSQNISEKVVLLMTEMGITSRDLDSFPAGINLLLHDALWQCRENPPTDWTTDAYNLLQRPDLAAQAELVKKNISEANMKKQLMAYDSGSLPEALPTIKQVDDTDQEDGMEDVDSGLLKLRFPEDHRVAETRRLLQSSKPVPIALVQRPDVSDHDFIEEQEKHLYAICARTMALPVGRGMFTLRTATPVVTEPLPLPKLCLTGKAPPRGVTVELSHIDYPQNMQHWPLFHNGVANGLRISPDAHNIDSTWITFNKPKNGVETNMEHAGFLMALGLNGHLPNLTVLNTYDYLSKSNEMTSIGIILGLSASMRGTANKVASVTKMLSIHVEALLPPTSMELDVPQNVQVAALLGVGLVYQGSAHRHITEVLLAEIGRPPGPEMENSIDRESYSLAAGLALGLVTLRQGGRPSGLSDLNVPDTLHYYMIGGNKRPLEGAQKDKYKVPSFQIREGSTVNLDVTAPGATLALGLMYLGTGNKALADWMSPPGTEYLLDFVRPDFLMLRILSRGLIMWDDIRSDRDWVENQIPETIRPFCMVKRSSTTLDIDYEAMNQAYCNIVAGACFAMGLKYAGSANQEAFGTLLHFCHMFTSLTAKSIADLAGKPTIETCLNVVLLSTSMVMAGTGNLEIMRIVRHLRRRVGLTSSAVVTYGSHLAIHMALGLLFLGGGRYTLSNSPASVAALICAFYPKFPTHSSDNRYHLQAFRHLYVLAVEPRLVIPKDVITGRMCYAGLKVVHLNGSSSYLQGPCLIPDLNTLAKLCIEDERYWSVVFERGRNWDQLLKLLASCGFIEVKQRAGCLSYLEDKFGYRSQLARTLTHSKTVPWDPPPKVITSFSSDCTIRHFTENFLTPETNSSSSINETKLLKTLTQTTYDCVIKDKEAVLSSFIALVKAVEDLGTAPNTLQLWQFKLACAQVLDNSFSVNLISPEVVLALHQKVVNIMNCWEFQIENALKLYVLGNCISCSSENVKQLASYVILYDIPFNVWDADELGTSDENKLEFLKVLCNLASRNCSPETIDKVSRILSISMQ